MAHRLATIADLPQIVEIYNSTIASRAVTADTDCVTVDSRREWFHSHEPATHPLWVVESAGSVRAWLAFSPFYGRPAYAGTAEVSLYVRDTERGQGLGRQLLGSAIGHAPKLGISHLLGFIFAHNHPSLTLFATFAFQQWGRLPGVALLDGVERDLVIVGRRV